MFSLNSCSLNIMYSPTALLIHVYEAIEPTPSDPAKPPIDAAVETALIIQSLFDFPLLIRVRGIDKEHVKYTD